MRTISPVYASPFSVFKALDREFESPFTQSKGAQSEVREFDDSWKVAIDMPGVKRENLEIEYENDTLTVVGKRSSLFEEEAKQLMKRNIHVPEGVDPEGIQADLNHGVLTLSLPKSEKQKPRKILINAH